MLTNQTTVQLLQQTSTVDSNVRCGKFFQIHAQVCQIPWHTTANFPRVAINLLRPVNQTEYAAFVVGKLLQLTDTVCLPNKQAVFQISSIFSIFLTLELEWQSCISRRNHVYIILINFLRPPKPNQNMMHLSRYHRPVQNSVKFRENVDITWKRANSAARLKIPTVVPTAE